MLMLLKLVMQKTYRALDVVACSFTVLLQGTVSPLEISACIVVAGAGELECHRGQLILAAVVLLLATCDGMCH